MDKEIPKNANEECPGVNSTNAGKSEACEGCPNQGACSSGSLEVDPSIAVINEKFKAIKHVIFVLSGKDNHKIITQLANKDYEYAFDVLEYLKTNIEDMISSCGREFLYDLFNLIDDDYILIEFLKQKSRSYLS